MPARRLLAWLGGLLIVASAAAGAWLFGPAGPGWGREDPDAVRPSPELAERAWTELRALWTEDGRVEVRLSGVELQSLVTHRFAERLPEGVSEARVALRDSSLEVGALLDVERLLGSRAPEMLRRVMGDSSRTTVLLQPGVPRPGVLRLRIRRARAGGVEIPTALVPWLLERSGLRAPEDVPDAVEFATGYRIVAARVDSAGLVLVKEDGAH